MTALQSRLQLGPVFETANRAALLAYVASTPLSSVQSFGGMSLSFAFAVAFFVFKAAGQLLFRGPPRLTVECATVVALLLYLVIADSFVHGQGVKLTYYVTFLLNCIMLVALVDEFRRSPALLKEAIVAFCATSAFMAICMMVGMGTVSQDGRMTFLGVNENEMALVCLAAFTFVALYMFRTPNLNAWRHVFSYGIATIFIIVTVRTGTRFTLFALYFELVILILAGVVGRNRIWLGIGAAVSWFVIAFMSTVSSPVMIDRLDLSAGLDRPDSSGALQLGGRLSMWLEALQAFQQSPIFGLGYTGYENMQLRSNPYFSLPHNFGLEIAAIGGTIGLALLLALLLQLARRIGAGWVESRSLDPLIMAIPLLAAGMFLNIASMKVIWFLLATVMTYPIGPRSGDRAESVDGQGLPSATAGADRA